MSTNSTVTTLATVALLASFAGCGGGGGGSSDGPAPASPPVNAQPTAVTASGAVTGFSSVFVNGVKYEVEGDTVVAVEGEGEVVGDDSRLRMGMKVRVRGYRDEAGLRVAERIEYDDDLKGPARDVVPGADDPALGTFTVLGQTVVVDANTTFDDDVGDNNGDGTVDVGDLTLAGGGQVVVAVSGLHNGDGLVATRIERIDGAAGVPGTPDDEFEVKGFVDSVAPDGGSFVINGATFLVITGAGGTSFQDGLAADGNLVGIFVEVKVDQNASDELIAVRVEREDDVGDRNGDGELDDDDRFGEFEIEGILVSVDTSVTPHVVVIGATTLRVADAAALVGREGNRLELKGSFDAGGVLLLQETRLEVENSIRIEDRVAAVDPAAGTLTTRLGVIVTPTGASRIEDDTAGDDSGDHLTPAEFLARVPVGGFVEARGFPNDDGSVTWRRVELEDEDDQQCELRGPVQSVEGTDAAVFSFVIQGVTVDVSQIVSDDHFEGSADQTLGRQAFFDALTVGTVVEAGSDDMGAGCQNGTLTAEEVEFEHGDGVAGSVPPGQGDDDDPGVEITGTPESVTSTSFAIDGRFITVVGNTLIDDSIIEAVLGREIDGDRRFDQLPADVTLADLLPGTFAVQVQVDGGGVALRIEDV